MEYKIIFVWEGKMKILNFRVFRGRNIYSHKKCIRLNLDLEGYSEILSKEISNFNEKLVFMLPELKNHRCEIDEESGFIKRLAEGTYLAHVTEHIIIALHNMIDLDISYGKAREISGDNYYIIYEYEYKNTGIEAASIAVDFVNSLINNEFLNLDLRLNKLKKILMNEQLGVSTLNICKEAQKRGIPILKIGEESMFQLGYGKYSKIIQATMDSETSSCAINMVDKLFKDIPKTIPLIAVTGTNGKTTTTRLITHILSIAGYCVGMTTTSGIYIDGKCIFKGDTTGPKSALTVLMNKNVDAAVLETARGGMIREGLAYDLADVAVITNITEDHLGIDGVETIEDLAKVKALVGEAVKEDGYVVINGDDKMSVSILPRLTSKLIIFTKYKDNKVMLSNIKNGGYGIYVDNGELIIKNKSNLEKIIDIKDIGITFNGLLKYNIENAMAACAATVGLGIGLNIIKQGLKSFFCNRDQNPGRFNMYLIDNVTIILDYGHNIEGYKGVLDAVKAIKHNNLIGVIGMPGDRPDSHMLEVGKCCGQIFDYIFIKEDEDRRGRAKGEVVDILEKGVLSSGFCIMNIEKVLNETEAFKSALDIAQDGDIVIIFFDKPDPLMDVMRKKIEESKIKLLVKS